jgi:aldehyde dehydrogenase (NAD+)
MELAQFTATLNSSYARLRKSVSEKPRDYEWRISQLRALKRMLEENDKAISAAMWTDMRKSEFECAATEQGIILSEIDDALKNLKKWMRPRRASTPLYNQLGRSKVVHEPLGLTLIIGAWNYPINLLFAPLVGAIAGGNGAMLKPSELPTKTAELIGQLVPKYMDPDLFAVVQGGPDETGILLDLKFDLIFFTGSGPVGKIILAKAAPHLTPVILELGGKSPAVIAPDADIKISARRIAWGKFMNAGQTCVAPDYILAHKDIREEFISALKTCLHEFYGADVIANPDFCRIINTKNFDRLNKLKEGLKVLYGGESNRDQLFIAPTLVEATAESAIMKEEVFGPILPILEMDDTQEILNFINARPKPLSLYVFTKSQSLAERFIQNTSSGALCVNDVVIHMPEPELPFGGVGDSGMGGYHGEFSFKSFTHAKGVLQKLTWPDVPVRYPPYSPRKAYWLKWLFK